MINFAFQSGKEETGPSQKARHAQTVFVIVILNDFNLQCSASPSILTSILMFMLLIFVAVGPVLEIEYRGYRGRRTKDIWEDQKAGVPKNLQHDSIRSLGNQTTWGTNKIKEAVKGRN